MAYIIEHRTVADTRSWVKLQLGRRKEALKADNVDIIITSIQWFYFPSNTSTYSTFIKQFYHDFFSFSSIHFLSPLIFLWEEHLMHAISLLQIPIPLHKMCGRDKDDHYNEYY